jgi:TonB family protein
MSAPSTQALQGTRMASANFEFKSRYMRTLEIALLIAGAFHLLVIFAVPPIEIQPYRLKERKMQAIDIPEEIVIPPPPAEVERPQLPTELEISEDVSLEETIPETDFNPFAPPEMAEDTGSADNFYAFDSPPTPIKTVAPEYPELAQQAGAEGRVSVEVTIDETGRVIAARVVYSNTIKSLEEAARNAAMGWLFTPAKQRDVAVKARIAIPFDFKLRS